MPEWGVTVIASLCTALVSVTGVIGYLKANSRPGNPNGTKGLDAKFTAQVLSCNERFMDIAEDRGEVKASLKSIDARLENIEKGMTRRDT